MSKPLIEGIKGLTAKDRKKWEKEFEADIKGQDYTDEEINMAVFNTNFRKAFSNREDYAELQTLSDQEAINFWNAYIDSNENPITKYSVEHGDYTGNVQEGALPYNPETGLPTNSIDELFGYSTSLNDNRKNIIDSNLDSFAFDTKDFIEKPEIKFDEKLYKTDPRYYYEVDNYSKQIRQIFDDSSNAEASYVAFKKFDSVASQVSNQYNHFKNTDRLGLTPGDIKDVMSYYYAITDLTGDDEEANKFVKDYIQNRIADRQTTGEKYKNAFKGIGAAAIGSTIATFGALKAALGEAWNDEDYNEDLSGWSNYWNKVLNNDLTRRGNDIITYQNFNEEDINVLKAAGIQGNIFKTVEEEQGDLGDMVFSENFIPEMIQQHGFTVGSSLISFGTGVLTKGITKGVTKTTTKAINTAGKLTGNSVKAKKAADATKEILEAIGDKAGGFFAAGLAGTGESVINGLEQYQTMIDRGTQLIMEDYQEWATPKLEEYQQVIQDIVMQESYRRMNSENPMSEEEMDNLADNLWNAKLESLYQEYQTTQEDRFRQLEIEAIQAQNTRAAADQMLTGFLNATLKSTLMHPSVKKTFSKIDKANPYTINEVTGAIEDLTTLTKVKKYAKGILGEAFGEGFEEAGSEIAGGFAEGWHGSDFEKYLENGYNVVGEDTVHQNWASSLWGGLKGMGEAAVDKNTMYSFISGALSSGISLGNPVGVYNAAQALRDPNMSFKDKARAVQTAFIRSSFIEGYQNTKRELAEQKDEAKALLDFMKDANNTNIHTDVIRLSNFASQRDMSTEDELHYRDSQLGTAVSQITTLEKLKEQAPIYYNTVMKQLNNYKNLDVDSAEGKKAIEEYRNAGLASVEETDADIIATIRKNADEFLQLKDKVLKRQQQVKRRYGNDLDDETVNAMVFGDISYDSYEERKQTMSKEVNDSFEKGKDSTTQLHEKSNTDAKQKQHIIKYGDAKTTLKREKQLEESISDDEAKIKSLKNNLKKAKRKDKSRIQAEIKTVEDRLSNNRKTLKDMTTSYSKTGLDNTDINNVLSEEDIMSLSNEDRAKVLSQDFYNNASEEQKEVIDNLKNILANGDASTDSSNSLIKINDIARLEKAQNKHHEIRQSSKKDLTAYGKTIKANALNRMSKDRIKHIGTIEDYEQFKIALEEALNNPENSMLDYKNALSILKDNNNFKKWQNKKKLERDYSNALKRSFTQEKNTDRHEMLGNIIIGKYLADKEIPMTNTDLMSEMLNVEDLQEYYKALSKDKDAPIVDFTDSMIQRFIQRIKGENVNNSIAERIQTPIKPDDKPSNAETPQTPIVEVDPEVKKDLDAINIEQEDELTSDSVDDFISKVIASNYNTLTSEARSKFVNMLGALSSYKRTAIEKQKIAKEIILNAIKTGFVNLDTKSQIELAKTLHEKYKDTFNEDEIATIIINLYNINNKDFVMDNSGKVTFKGEDITEDYKRIDKLIKEVASNGTIETNTSSYISSDIVGENESEIITQAEEKHNVEKWLKSNKSNHKAEVMFVVATDLLEVADKDYAPLYMVIEDSEGTIEIDNKKYQVIGIVASKGAHPLSKIQEMAVQQTTTEDEGFRFVRRYNSGSTDSFSTEPLKFYGFRIKSTAPKHLQVNEGGSNNVKDLLTSELTVDDFISKMTEGRIVTDADNVTTVAYQSPYDDKTVTPKPTESQKGQNRTYISYVEETGKPKSGPYNGEAEVEIFINPLDVIILPNGVSFVDFFSKGITGNIFKPEDVGFAISNYAKTLYKGALDIVEKLKDVGANTKLSVGPKKTRKFIKNEDITNYLSNLINSLNNNLNASNVILDYTSVTEEDGSIKILLVAKYNDDTISQLTIGNYKTQEDGTIAFIANDNFETGIYLFMSDLILNDDKNGLRTNNSNYPLIKYQISYKDISNARIGSRFKEKPSDKTEYGYWAAYQKIKEAINNGILFVSKGSLNRRDYHVQVNNSPLDGLNNTSTSTLPNVEGAPPQEVKGKDGDTGIPVNPAPIVPKDSIKAKIKTALDNLAEKYKNLQERLQQGGTREGIRVTSRNYSSNTEIDPIVAAVGNLYDEAIRDIINDNLDVSKLIQKYPNFTQEEAQKLIEAIDKVKEIVSIIPGEWTIDARSFLLSGNLPEKRNGVLTEAGKNGTTEFVSGTPDIVAYNDKGEIIIIDVKTYADSTVKLNEQAKHGWRGQTTDYKDLIENNTGGKVIGIYAFPIKVSYSKNATVVDGKLKEGIAPASVNATYSTIDGNILVNLSTVKEVKSAEDKHTGLPKSDKLFDFDADDDDIDISPFGKKAEQLQSSICTNNNI